MTYKHLLWCIICIETVTLCYFCIFTGTCPNTCQHFPDILDDLSKVDAIFTKYYNDMNTKTNHRANGYIDS